MSSPISGRAPAWTSWSPGSDATCCSSPEPGPADAAPEAPSTRAGRDGRLCLAFESRGGRTVLTERRFTLPLQALEPMDLTGDGAATLLLLNPTGGILGGDHLETRITLGPESRVCCSTPSATRVYRSPAASALQRTDIEVGRAAVLEWLPDHLIPSPGARLRQRTEIRLAPDATLLYLDAWAVGRAARGEPWGFDLLDSSLFVRGEIGPLLRERSILGGPPRDGLGGTEGFGYVATFVAMRPDGREWSQIASAIHHDLVGAAPGCRWGVTTLGRGGVLLRLLCTSAPGLQRAVEVSWARCRRDLLGLRPLSLRKL